MEMIERIALCKQCKNRSFDPAQGIICGLTKAKPTFETACKDFIGDEEIKTREPLQMRLSDKEGRGGCLTAVLVLIIIGSFFNIFSSLIMLAMQPHELMIQIPMHLFILSFISGGLALSGAIMMFMWRKTGVYLYGSSILINIAVQVQMPYFQSIQVIGMIIGIIIVFTVITPKWSNFK